MNNKRNGLGLLIAVILLIAGVLVGCENSGSGDTPEGGEGLVYTPYMNGWSVSVSPDFTGTELTVPAEYNGKTVLRIENFPTIPTLQKLTIHFSSDSWTLNAKLFENLTELSDLTLTGGFVTVKEGALPSHESLRKLTLKSGSFTLEDRCIPTDTYLEALTLESVTLDMGPYSGFYTLHVDTMTVRNTTVSLSATRLLEGLTTMKVGTLYLGYGGNVSVQSITSYPVDRLILEEDFSADNGSATLTLNKVIFAEIAPIAAEIHIPESVTALPENFFGKKESCTVYYGGLAADFDTVSIPENGNEAYFDGAVTIYGKEHSDIPVTFDAMNGTEPVVWSVRYGHNVSRIEDPTREGHIFMGWYTEAEGGEPWSFEDNVITSPVTLYARWLSLSDYGECEILESRDFALSEGTGETFYYAVADKDTHTMDISSSFTVSEYATLVVREERNENTLPLSALPLMDGDNRFTLTVTSGNGENQKNYTLIIFRSFVCTVIFDDGETKSSVNAEVGSHLDERSALREGYDFLGWYVGDTKWDFATHTVTGNITLTARFTGKTYYAHTQGLGKHPVTFGEAFTLPVDQQQGCAFNGWRTEDGTFVTDGEGKSLNPWSVAGDLTLYPDHSVVNYRITYQNLFDATNPNPATHGGNTALTLRDPERVGYVFKGWTLNGSSVTRIPAGQTEDVTLTANWQAVTYSITVENTKGLTVSFPGTYTVEDTVILGDLSCEGYTFLGWYCDGVKLTSIQKGSTGDITLRAKWLGETYSITYLGLENATHNNPVAYELGLGLSLTDASKVGHRFLGWYLDGERITAIPADRKGDITLTAMWEIHTYTVTFLDASGHTLATETVPHGGSVQDPPEPPTIYHKIFVRWSASLYGVTSDLTVTPIYKEHTYTVTFDTDGNGDIPTQHPYYGEAPVRPADPVNGEFSFLGWYLAGGERYDFSYPLDGDATLTAVWLDYIPIYTMEDFALMEGSSGKFRLMNDINCYGMPFTPIQSFSGSLDGGGHTVRSFSLIGSRNLAMILENNGTVKNLTVRDVSLTQKPDVQGASTAILIALNTGTLENCRVEDCSFIMEKPHTFSAKDAGFLCATNTGTVRGCEVADCVAELTWSLNTRGTSGEGGGIVTFGAIVGGSSGTVESCIADADVEYTVPYIDVGSYLDDTTHMYIGGIVGHTSNAVKNCSATLRLEATVNAGRPKIDIRIGGIAGELSAGYVETSTAVCNISLDHAKEVNRSYLYVGGAIGVVEAKTEVRNCASFGRIRRNDVNSDANRVGGFMAHNAGNVYSCYSAVAFDLQRDNRAAGFCDENTASGSIRSCFALGYFYMADGYAPDAFINLNSGTVRACYYDDAMKIIGTKEQAIMATDGFAQPVPRASLLTPAFMEETLNWNPTYWDADSNQFPVLKKHPSPSAVIATPNRYEYGSITANGTFFDVGDTVTLTATPLDTYVFLGWFKEGSTVPVSTELTYTFTAEEGYTFVEARFRQADLEVYAYEDLLKIQRYNLSTTTVYLKNDINCMGEPLPMIEEFYGTLEGGGFAIFNFASTLAEAGETALIRENYGTVKNLTLSGSLTAAATSGTSKLAFFAVRNHEGGVIENCRAVGSLKMVTEFRNGNKGGTISFLGGGIAVENAGLITDCHLAAGRASSDLASHMAFDVSMYNRLAITNDHSYTATVNLTAGFIAAENTGSVVNCHNGNATLGSAESPARFESNLLMARSGLIASSATGRCNMSVAIGGIVGISREGGEISSCVDHAAMYLVEIAGTDTRNETSATFVGVYDGYLSSDMSFGGITGRNEGTVGHSLSEGLITYASDNINGMGCGTSGLMDGLNSAIGGISGQNIGTVSNTSHRGILVVTSAQTTFTGGIAGDNSGVLSNCYGGGLIMAEGIADEGKVYMNLKFWEGFGGSRYRHGSVSVGGMAGRNASGATVSNCLSNYRFDEMKNCDDMDTYSKLINLLLIPVHIKDAFLGLFKTPPSYQSVMQIGTIVGNGQNQGNIQNCYYVKNGEYDYTDGDMLTDDLSRLTAELIRSKLYWSITDDQNAQGSYVWLVIADHYADPDHQGTGSIPLLPTISLIPLSTAKP